jgi:hypothetical protein
MPTLFGSTYESLVHKLGCRGPRTTKELLDIATSHTSGEEVVGAIFDRTKGKAKRDKNTGEGTSNRPNKKKNKQRHGSSLVIAADRKGIQTPTEGTPDHVEKLLERWWLSSDGWLPHDLWSGSGLRLQAPPKAHMP